MGSARLDTKAEMNFSPVTKEVWTEAYQQLAWEKDFPVLPLGAEIDMLQRSSPAELSNALLVGFVCTIFALESLPGLSQETVLILMQVNTFANVVFTLDYLGRWWSRGCRWTYLLTPTMLTDLLAVLPFLLRPFVPQVGGLELNFLKLFRVLQVYRYFRPEKVQNIIRLVFPAEAADAADNLIGSVRPYQLQVVRTFGIVFTLLFVTAGLVFQAERGTNPQFTDFFTALYFSLVSLSTVGFGDIAPVTAAGKITTAISVTIGLILVPYQASLVASAVAEEQRLEEEQERAQNAEAVLSSLEQSRAQLAWDVARIAELEDRERQERERVAELERRVSVNPS